MKKTIVCLLVLFVFGLTSCLTVEKKSYTIKLEKDGSGVLTIDYYNIFAELSEDEKPEDAKQYFDELMKDYFNGEILTKLYPNVKTIKKELFEKDGKLCGRVIIDFGKISDIGLYQQTKKSDLMFALCSSMFSETYLASNGMYGGESMPVVFWNKKEKNLQLDTSLTEPTDKSVSLLNYYLDSKK
ncbi:MAG: hypothetical protein WCK02_13580 [Bacteroidota bacterium]